MMDTPTQALLGAVTAHLGFRQRIGPAPTWAAVAAEILPDLDILVTPFLSLTGAEADELTRLTIHRGLSHSLLMAPILSLPIALLWRWFRNRQRASPRNREGAGNRRSAPSGNAARPRRRVRTATPFWLLYACVFVALFTSPLLDWCTSYGTQLLAPLTNTRYAIDVVPIVDLIYTPLLVLTLLGCYVARKMRPGRAVRPTLIIGWVGFLLSVGYLAAGRVMHDWAVEQATRTAGCQRERILRADAYPAIGTIFLWRTVIETEGEWIVMRAHRFSSQPPETWARKSAGKVENEWTRRARSLPEVKTYDWFATHRTRTSYARENGHHVVEFHDMRYGWPLESVGSFWPLAVTFSDSGELLHVGRERRHRRGHFGSWAARAWADIWNP